MPHKIITIAQQKGGSGKTTIAAHLAAAFSKNGRSVTAVDIDPQGSFTKWHAIREEKYGKGNTGMNFITTSVWRLHAEIGELKEKSDLLIIDTPPHAAADIKSVLSLSDLVIIPVQPSPLDIWSNARALEMVSAERIPHRIVVNRLTGCQKQEEIAKSLPNRLDTFLGNNSYFASAMAYGSSVIEALVNNNAAEEIRQLTNAIETLLFPMAEEVAA